MKKLCWKCGKVGNFKNDDRSKSVGRGKRLEDTPSTKGKTSLEGGDVSLYFTSTHPKNDVWLIDLGVSFHMTPHKGWFCEYEKYNGGDSFLGDESTTTIIGHKRVKLLLKDGRIKTLRGVLHIPDLARNLISISKMNDIGVHTVFEKDKCKVVRGDIILMSGVRDGTFSSCWEAPSLAGVIALLFLRVKVKKTKPLLSPEKILCYGIKYWEIVERRSFKHYKVKVRLKVCLIAN